MSLRVCIHSYAIAPSPPPNSQRVASFFFFFRRRWETSWGPSAGALDFLLKQRQSDAVNSFAVLAISESLLAEELIMNYLT